MKDAGKPWMTDEIVELINERRRYTNQNNTPEQQHYKRIRNELQRKIKRAKEEWLDEQCKKAEEFLKRGNGKEEVAKIKKRGKPGL